ncbi:VCBS repeat-containing protein [Roseivirga sp. E12]|uniref:VCBS repeat-containing protein n=1 Tax=Roseivirga sp. E12 TaxID=2819237 RepID=UPI001ABD18E6|nr:VCBS repeat-containing protein [Roseivirga sp. E12]MBO3700702.1 VCBS repeat-containing protein [Roseivirga sp. E12]
MNRLQLLLFSLLIFLAASCKNEGSKESRFALVNSNSGFSFKNTITESNELNAYHFLYIYNGSGVGIGDFNNDGLQDVFMAGNMVTSKLFLNKGELKFEDITEKSGLNTEVWVHGVSVVDINEDGHDDIYLSIGGLEEGRDTRNKLFINNGDLTFTESAEHYGLADPNLTTHSSFFDYDNDGDLDVFLINYENNPEKDPNVIRPKSSNGKSKSNDRLYRNDNGKFIDVSLEAGIIHEGYGLGINVHDFNQDGWLDLYVSNDFVFDDNLYINNQDGTFTDKLGDYFSHTSNFGMGIDMADLNNDALLDIVQVDMLPEDNRRQKKLLSGLNYDRQQILIERGYTSQYMRNSLQLNTKSGKFKEIGTYAGIHTTDWSWSPLVVDLDNDGLRDIFITNGYVKDVTDIDFRDYIVNETQKGQGKSQSEVVATALDNLKGEKIPNYAFTNTGNLQFENITSQWGLDAPSFSTGAAYADLDNDGDLEVITNNLNQESFLYENRTNELDSTSFLRVRLTVDGNTTKALGSKVVVTAGEHTYAAEIGINRGFQSSVEPVAHFGMGTTTIVDSLKVIWSDNTSETFVNVRTNQVLSIEKSDNSKSEPGRGPSMSHFESRNFDYAHMESNFVDFKREALLPHKLSTEGPATVTGDVNNDGLNDLFIAGAAGSPSYLYLQQRGGGFKKVLLEASVSSEDTDALFFDVDNDGDKDLYVASGSNEFPENDARYQDRLYINQGNGELVLNENRLPEAHFSSAKVVANDFDQDGDIDLFVAGRLTPSKYPLPGTSQLLENDNGKFRDVIQEKGLALQKLGMLKDALWADLNGDGQEELVVTGEYMSIDVFGWKDNVLQPWGAKNGLAEYKGWWNTLKIVDIDNDGDSDILAGNLGLNSRYKASSSKPLSVYAYDYDQNGRLDPVIGYYVNDKEYLIHDLTTLATQISLIRKKFTSNISYAEAEKKDIFDQAAYDQAYTLRANHFKTSLFINDGVGNFELKELPFQAQFSSVHAIEILDVDGDNMLDVILGGNTSAPEVFSGNQDAQASLLLLGQGNGNFEVVDDLSSGLIFEGDVTSLQKIEINGQPHLFVFRNNDQALSFALNGNSNLLSSQQ